MIKKARPKIHFKTNVLLKSIIGKDLINNDNIAVLELVKNSFDAGSPEAEIIFKNIQSNDDLTIKTYSGKTSKIIITDDGKGMNLYDIKEKWLNIAYSEKKKIKKENNRVLAGVKGVGRFSCDRLGEYLDIFSKTKTNKIVHLNIDWKAYEFDEEQETKDIQIQDIEVSVKEISQSDLKRFGHKIESTGTILEISKLRANWDGDRILKLRRYLERLLNPNQSFDKNKFTVTLTANEFDKTLNGQIKNQIFEKLDFTTTSIESNVSKDGLKITTILRDKGKSIFTLIEKNPFQLLKDIKVVIYFLNPYSKIYFNKQTGLKSVQFGSIFLFKNGFRISPYGDEGNDWLRMEIRKGQGQKRYLGTRDVVGRIEINDPEGNFKEVTSREGLVENDAFLELTKSNGGYFFKTLKRLEKFVVEGLDWDRVPEEILKQLSNKEFQNTLKEENEQYEKSQVDKNKKILEIINSIVRVKPENIIELDVDSNLILNLIGEEKAKFDKVFSGFEKFGIGKLNKNTEKALLNVKLLLDKKEKELELARKKLKNVRSSLKQIKSENYFLQSQVGVEVKDLMSYHHHIGIASGVINDYLIMMRDQIKNNEKITNEELEDYITNISYETNKISTIVNFATKARFNLDSEEIEDDLANFIREYIENVSKEIVKTYEEDKLTLKVSMNKSIKFIKNFTPIFITIIIDNLLKNSSKAGAKKVKIDIAEKKGYLEVHFIDDGKGIPTKNAKKIYDFGFTTTDGSGLGLFHVKKLIEEMGGKIILNSTNKKGAEFILTFPK